MAKVLLAEYHNGKIKRYQDTENPQGISTYLALFRQYVLEHCTIWDENEDGDIYIWNNNINGNSNTYKHCVFTSCNQMIQYCKEHNITLREHKNIDHPLAHGLPDTRSIH